MYFLFHFAIIHFTVGNLSALDDVLATPLTLYRKQASSLPPSGSRTFLDTNEKKKKTNHFETATTKWGPR